MSDGIVNAGIDSAFNNVVSELHPSASDTSHEARIAVLEKAVCHLYEALDSQIRYHGQRNGPVAGSPAGGTGGLSV